MTKAKKPAHKLDLNKTLNAIEYRKKDYYMSLSDEERKAYAPYILVRYLSNMKGNGDLHEHYLEYTNELVNKNFWELSKYPELQHKLLCVIGLGMKTYHPWIALPKAQNKGPAETFLREINPGINKDELKLLFRCYEVEDFKNLCFDYALPDKEVKKLLTNFKKLKKEIND